MIAAAATRPALVRAAAIAVVLIVLEWTRAIASQQPALTVASLIVGGAALAVPALLFKPERLGLGTTRFWLRVLGGLALGVVLLLPAAVRPAAVPLIPGGLAAAAVVVSIGEEIAFRGALYAALEDAGGAPLAVLGSTVLWTLAHLMSHPAEFLGAVAAAGLLLALWRWACNDLVGPIVGHVLADLAL